MNGEQCPQNGVGRCCQGRGQSMAERTWVGSIEAGKHRRLHEHSTRHSTRHRPGIDQASTRTRRDGVYKGPSNSHFCFSRPGQISRLPAPDPPVPPPTVKMKFATALLSAGLMVGSAMADSKKCNGKSCPTTTSASVPTTVPVVESNVFPWERLDKNNSVWFPTWINSTNLR